MWTYKVSMPIPEPEGEHDTLEDAARAIDEAIDCGFRDAHLLRVYDGRGLDVTDEAMNALRESREFVVFFGRVGNHEGWFVEGPDVYDEMLDVEDRDDPVAARREASEIHEVPIEQVHHVGNDVRDVSNWLRERGLYLSLGSS